MPLTTPDPAPSSPSRWHLFAIGFSLAAAAVLAFLPALSADFVNFDDLELIVQNPNFRGFTGDHLRWMFTTTLMGHYQPLSWLSFAVDNAIAGGVKAPQFHLTSVLIHAANTALLFFLIRRVLALGLRARSISPWAITAAAAAGALFWGAHPLRAESVAWVTERRDVLSGFFLLLAALAYLRYAQVQGRVVRFGLYLFTFCFLAFSLLSKAWGMTFFATMLLLDVWPLRRLPVEPWRWFTRRGALALVEKVPFVALGAAASVMAARAQGTATGAVRTLADWPVSSRIAQAAYGLVYYAWKTISPTDLAPRLELPEHLNPLAPEFLACYAIVALAAVAVILLARRFPWLPVAAGVYVITVSPVLGVLQSGDQFVADRYSYLACIPWSALLAGGLALALARVLTRNRSLPLTAAVCAASVWIGAMFWMTPLQAAVWHDPLSLWSHTVDAVPSSSALTHYAIELQAKGRKEEAIATARRAVEMRDSDGRAWFILGNFLRTSKDNAGAESAYRHATTRMLQPYMAYVNLGTIIQDTRPDEALQCFRDAVADLKKTRTGSYAGAKLSGIPYLALGTALARRGEIEEARKTIQQGLLFDDSRFEAMTQLNKLPPAAAPTGPAPAPTGSR